MKEIIKSNIGVNQDFSFIRFSVILYLIYRKLCMVTDDDILTIFNLILFISTWCLNWTFGLPLPVGYQFDEKWNGINRNYEKFWISFHFSLGAVASVFFSRCRFRQKEVKCKLVVYVYQVETNYTIRLPRFNEICTETFVIIFFLNIVSKLFSQKILFLLFTCRYLLNKFQIWRHNREWRPHGWKEIIY